jgi:uncharacterized protein YutE (UPF0331/DUF86 family)
MIDPDLVRRKISLILGDLKALEPLARLPLKDYLAGEVEQLAAERLLERIAGRMIDVNYHVVTESGRAPPRDYYASFLEMGRVGVLPTDFARTIASAAGLRNRLVHEYDALDPVRIHAALGTAAAQVPLFLRHVEAHLATLEGPRNDET